MSDLGRFLEVVFGPREAFASAQGVIRHWTDRELASRATGGGRGPIGRQRSPSAEPGEGRKETSSTIDFWIELPDRFRLEDRYQGREPRHEKTRIVDGRRRWEIENGRVETNADDPGVSKRDHGPGLPEVECHFVAGSLRRYFVELVLESEGAVRTAGTDCLRIRATPRPGRGLWPHWLPCGADVYEFHADVERGTLLYVAGFFEGKVFETHEVERVVYDEPIDPARFVYTPRSEDRVRPRSPIADRVTLEEALSRLPFTILLPQDRTSFDLSDFMILHDRDAEEDASSRLTLVASPGVKLGQPMLWLKQSAGGKDRDLAGLAWEEFERDGQKFALSDPGEGMRILRLVRHGTHVSVVSELPPERLIELALSLVPASEPPRSTS